MYVSSVSHCCCISRHRSLAAELREGRSNVIYLKNRVSVDSVKPIKTCEQSTQTEAASVIRHEPEVKQLLTEGSKKSLSEIVMALGVVPPRAATNELANFSEDDELNPNYVQRRRSMNMHDIIRRPSLQDLFNANLAQSNDNS